MFGLLKDKVNQIINKPVPLGTAVLVAGTLVLLTAALNKRQTTIIFIENLPF